MKTASSKPAVFIMSERNNMAKNNIETYAAEIETELDNRLDYPYELLYDTRHVYIEINGDWKHQHLFAESIIKDWAKKNEIKIDIIEQDIEDTGEDFYSSVHRVNFPDL